MTFGTRPFADLTQLQGWELILLLNIPTCKSFTSLGDRSFHMAAPILWNDRPLFIRNTFSVNGFKKALI